MISEDYAIIKTILGGNSSAFRSIMDKYGNLVYRLAYTHLNDVEEARDLTQDIFIKIYKNLRKYNPEYKFFSWLYRISLNTINTYLGKRKRRPVMVPLENTPAAEKGGAMEKDGPEIAGDIEHIIAGFKKDTREIFVLFYYEEMEIREISEITGKSPENIKVILHRGRKDIREALGAEKR